QTCNRIERLPVLHYKGRFPFSRQLLNVLKIGKLCETEKAGSQKTADAQNKQQHHSLSQKSPAQSVEFGRNPIPCNSRHQNCAQYSGQQSEPHENKCFRRRMSSPYETSRRNGDDRCMGRNKNQVADTKILEFEPNDSCD